MQSQLIVLPNFDCRLPIASCHSCSSADANQNRQSAIGNKKCREWLANPGGVVLTQPGSEALRLLLATLLTLPSADRPALLRKSSRRPNLAPSFCDAGAGEPFALQR